jgi:hypothetical protein
MADKGNTIFSLLKLNSLHVHLPSALEGSVFIMSKSVTRMAMFAVQHG